MHENEVARIIVNKAFEVHRALGPGLLESVYEKVLYKELVDAGLSVERQVGVPVVWKGTLVGKAYRADMIVEKKVLIELKSVEEVTPVHFKQVLSYLKLSGLKLGLLINFNVPLMKDGIRRVVNNLR